MQAVQAAAIVEIQVPPDPVACRTDAVIGVQGDLLVFHAAPKPLDEHVVPLRALAVHADPDLVLRQNAVERRSLVRVEKLWLAVYSQNFLQGLAAEGGLYEPVRVIG